MEDRQKVTCPHCNGTGKVKVPGLKDGQPHTYERECRHCKGTGKLVMVVDSKIFSGRKPRNIITLN